MTTVLVVDDSALDRRLVGGLLERQSDWNVIYAKDGQDALEQMELHVPDVVLTDLQMPEMNGFELVQSVKSDYPLTPVILMTAKGSEEIAVQALKWGASSYVPKKELATDLVENVQLVLSAAQDQRSHTRLMNRMNHAVYSFVLENDFTLIPSAVNYLQQAATNLRICTETERLRIGVALEESLLNAFYHGNLEISSKLRDEDHTAYYELAQQRCKEDPYQDRKIYIDARLTPLEAIYIIRDEGPGFDVSELPDPTDPANLERPSGRGLLLMRTFMDEINHNETGNEVTLVKRKSAET